MSDTITIHTQPGGKQPSKGGTTWNGDFIDEISTLTEHSIEAAPDAAVCGALGCRESAKLVRCILEEVGQRVFCPDHMTNLIRKEVLENE
jgi:hypothetical protein